VDKVMLQFRHAGPAPSTAEAAALLDLRLEEIDPDFGVVTTDPAAGLHTVLIDPAAAARAQARLTARGAGPEEGVFANPRVEPMGPPR
jgi:hypothetical protein